jgi:uncharacterized membrane protein YozB (DUF420 family)
MRPGSSGCDERPELVLGLTRTEGLGQASVREAAVITMLDGMSTDELSRSTSLADDHRVAKRTPLLRRPWVVPLALLTVIFIGYAVPPYLSLDPARARIQPMPPHASYYPLLVTHIFLGSITLLAACLQVWPWLRRSHPAIHRWSGRVYVTAALIASVCVMIIAPMGLYGANQRVPNTILAVLWFGTTLAGFRAIRQRRYADHRQWMLRSIALAFSIVAFRVWMLVAFAILVPEIYTGAEVDSSDVAQAVGVTSWMSWVVNLLIVEWWLLRRRTSDASTGREVDQSSANRITTRGNPPETAVVSAALIKPASSKSMRVPT